MSELTKITGTMAKTKRWINLADEMPTIGSRWRLVEADVGRKWAYVKSATSPVPTNRTRIRVQVWNKIEALSDRIGVPFKEQEIKRR